MYEFRKMQMDKAEQEGYQEAKEVYEKLIKEKKEKLSELQQKVEGNNKQMVLNSGYSRFICRRKNKRYRLKYAIIKERK